MEKKSLQIIVIDDNLNENDPLLVEIKLRFPQADVILKKKSSEGLSYLMSSLNKKTIVLLDYDLGKGEPNATEVLLQIRKKTSLVFVIVMTAKLITTIPHEDLIKYINNNALAFVNRTISLEEMMQYVANAIHSFDSRVDCTLEQWIYAHTDEERKKPYLSTSSGKIYALDDLLTEIRQQTPFGKEIEKNVLMLTIDLLTRGKKTIDD